MSPDGLLLIIYVTVALVAATLFMVVRDLLGRRRAQDKEPQEHDGLISLPPASEIVAPSPPSDSDDSWLGRLVAESGSEWTVDTVMLLAVAVGLAVGGMLFVWRDDVLVGAAGAILGIMAVIGLIYFLRSRRHRAIREQLPDVMELMARAVRAGESLDQAIALAGTSPHPPLADEFRHCARQMKMGLSLEAVMRGMVSRAPLSETRILAMTLIVQRRRGGNLPLTLERLAKVFRDRGVFYRQFRAATSMGRGSATLIALVALVLDVAVIFGKVELTGSLLTSNAGRVILAAAIGLQVLGIAWAMWLFRSDY